MIYLDNNSATPIDQEVLRHVIRAMEENFGNPSSMHSKGREARALLTSARDRIARALSVLPEEILFTSGGTEGINLILRGLFAKKKGHLITSNVEHAALENCAREVAHVTELPVGLLGAVTEEAVERAIRDDTRLIALAAANSETGVKIDLHGIAALAKSRGVNFFVDGVALLGKEPLTIPEGVTAMSFSGQKIHGPKGIGFLFVRKGFRFLPQITGGSQEYGKRAGTEAVPLIVGLAKAVESLGEYERILEMRDFFEKELTKNPKVLINGEGERISNTSNLAFLGKDVETHLMQLDMKGIAASHGSACQSGNFAPSRTLLNMGLPPERVNSSIRFSFSRMNTKEEVKQAIEIIRSLF